MKIISCIFVLVATARSENNFEEILKSGSYKFSTNMLKEVHKEEKIKEEKSCVLSPFSVLSPLAEIALASIGEARDEILSAMGITNIDIVKKAFAALYARIKIMKGVELKQANKIYVHNDFTINKEFAESSKEAFNTEIQNVDFQQEDQAADEINGWVEEHTNEHIKDLIKPKSLGRGIAVLLVSAIYFKGKWAQRFDKSLTTDQEFHVTQEKKVTLPMMHQTNTFKYDDNSELDAQILEMDHEGGESSFVLALPNKAEGVNDLIDRVEEPNSLHKALGKLIKQHVQVSLPRFKIETLINLVEILKKLNIKATFQAGKAKLENLLKQAKDLFVSSVIHKACFEVNEEGSEGAGGSQVSFIAASSLGDKLKIFKANRPFVFFLMHKNHILFTGVFRSH